MIKDKELLEGYKLLRDVISAKIDSLLAELEHNKKYLKEVENKISGLLNKDV